MALKAMRELPDFVMAKGSPDVEGWQVHDRDARVAGTVIDLVVDTRGDLVRYLVVQLGDGKHVLVPVGDLDLDEAMGVVRLVTLTREALAQLPAYQPPALSPELEQRYYVLFRREEPVGAADMSPLDYRIPPFRARGDRVDRLMHGPQRQSGVQLHAERVSHEAIAQETDAKLEAMAQAERQGPGKPVSGLPNVVGVGLLAASEPWDILDLSEVKDAEKAETADLKKLGPNAETEALWQSEQPGITAAFGLSRDLPEEMPDER